MRLGGVSVLLLFICTHNVFEWQFRFCKDTKEAKLTLNGARNKANTLANTGQ